MPSSDLSSLVQRVGARLGGLLRPRGSLGDGGRGALVIEAGVPW